MEEKEIYDIIVRIIKDNAPDLNKEELTMDSVVNTETALDSMGFILVICKIEAEFKIKIPDRQWSKMMTVGDVVHAVEKRLAKQ